MLKEIDYLINENRSQMAFYKRVAMFKHVLACYKFERELYELYEGFKYDPCQPRVPSGNPDGGQWATPPRGVALCPTGNDFEDYRRENEHVPGNDELVFKDRIYDQYGKILDQANVFIGGFFDSSDHGNMENSQTLNKNAIGDNYYGSHDVNDRSKISEFEARIPDDKQLNGIGHSWGGDSIADYAIANPGKVKILITLDPVSKFKPNYKKLKESVDFWINVDAVGDPVRGETDGDKIAEVGGDWGDGPEGFADIHIRVPKSHEDVDGMMNSKTPDGRTPQEILNGVEMTMEELLEQILTEGNEDFHLVPSDSESIKPDR